MELQPDFHCGDGARWADVVARLWPAAKGSLSEVHKACMRPGCAACREGRRHQAFLFKYREAGRTRCTYVPAGAVEALRQALDNGRALEQRLVAEGVALIDAHRSTVRRPAAGAPARVAAGRRGGLRPCVGVLSELDVFEPKGGYFRDLSDQTVKALRARGMNPMFFCGTVCPGRDGGWGGEAFTCPEFWEAAAQRRIDAAVFVCAPGTTPWLERVHALKIPAVGSPTSFPIWHGDIVAPGLRELQRQGATRIAMLTWDDYRTRPAFEQSLAELGLTSRPGWIAGAFNPNLSGSGWEAFREIWTAYEEKPDGLLVTDDIFFRDATPAIAELVFGGGRDLKIVTHANRDSEGPPHAFPHTRFEFDAQADAEALVTLLEHRLAGGSPADTPILPPPKVVQVGGVAPVRKLQQCVAVPSGRCANHSRISSNRVIER
jgi:DNA-binding LacI/PurR family transcriptional regulator